MEREASRHETGAGQGHCGRLAPPASPRLLAGSRPRGGTHGAPLPGGGRHGAGEGGEGEEGKE